MNNITLVFFTIYVTIHIFLKRHVSLLMAPQTCTLAGNFKVVWIHLAWFSHSVCAKQDNGVDCYDCVIQTYVNALCSHRRDISLCMILRHATIHKRTRTCLKCNEIPVLKWSGNSPEMNYTENVWNIMKKDNGNQLPCLKEGMWKWVCEAWYSVAPNVIEELNNLMPRSIADLIKQIEVQRILTFWCRRTGM